jgi:NAD(P)H-hydrate epimerase
MINRLWCKPFCLSVILPISVNPLDPSNPRSPWNSTVFGRLAVAEQPALSRDAVRDVDRVAIEDFGVPGIVLMENAGRNAAELLWAQGLNGPVVVCCGKGNNGGDGFVVARHLENRGADVRVLLFADPESLHGDAATNWRIVQKAGIPLTVFAGDVDLAALDAELQDAAWIVDALLGTGITGTIRGPYAKIIAAINASSSKVFAVDLPSGLDCDRGEPLGVCVRADVTATFVARKTGFESPAAKEWLGKVHVLDIGIPRALRDRVLHLESRTRNDE